MGDEEGPVVTMRVGCGSGSDSMEKHSSVPLTLLSRSSSACIAVVPHDAHNDIAHNDIAM